MEPGRGASSPNVPDASSAQAQRLFETLKQLVRQRGLTYRDLAVRLAVSESAVKKMFSAARCSVLRLLELARILDVPLGELVELAEEAPIRRVELSEAQQSWLLENPDCFAFYWKLAVERWPVTRIRDAFGLTDLRVRKILGALDDLGLLVLEPGDRIRLVQPDLVQWQDRGQLMDWLNRTWSQRLVEDVLGGQGTFRLTWLAMRSATARELADALNRLVDEFIRRARHEQATTPPDALETRRLLVALGEGSFVEGSRGAPAARGGS